MLFVKQSIFLAVSFLFVFIWQQTPASGYTIQTLGVLIALYLILSVRKKAFNPITASEKGSLSSVVVLNAIIFLFIIATGGLSSSVFFLLYFLAFGVAFVFEPAVLFIFVLGTILLFLPIALKDDITGNLLRLGSLAIIAPIAFFFSRQFRQDEKQEETLEAFSQASEDAANTIAKDVETVLKDEKTNLKEKDVEKLNDILEETEMLREQSKK